MEIQGGEESGSDTETERARPGGGSGVTFRKRGPQEGGRCCLGVETIVICD